MVWEAYDIVHENVVARSMTGQSCKEVVVEVKVLFSMSTTAASTSTSMSPGCLKKGPKVAYKRS